MDLDEHNIMLINKSHWTELKQNCTNIYKNTTQPFSNKCNIELEYPCLLAHVDEPWNFDKHRPCINLSRIGDGNSDCYYSDDERNTLRCLGNETMMGFNFLCQTSQICLDYHLLCNNKDQCQHGEDDIFCHFRLRPSNISCSGLNDHLCFNDTCILNGRCNGIVECPNGEDEYWCSSDKPPFFQSLYRNKKVIEMRKPKMITHLFYPMKQESIEVRNTNEIKQSLFPTIKKRNSNYTYKDEIFFRFQSEPENYYWPFVCGNDGLAVKYQQEVICFCPPSSYGDYCEYSSDRITILTHLNFVNYKIDNRIIIKVLITFLFKNRTIDIHTFYVQPQLQNNDIDYVKQKIYFVYPRTKEFIQQKRTYRNGTQMYHARFEVFILNNSNLILIDVWDYPIYFDFLPAYRLAKILKLNSSLNNNNNNNCSLCGDHGTCYTIVNNNKSIYCNCESGWYGEYCEHSNKEQCQQTCSSNSICRPNQRGILNNGEQNPYCLCLPGYYGSNCYFKYEQCEKNPCKNDGTCFIDYALDDIHHIKCLCSHQFYGDQCELSKHNIHIQLKRSNQPSDVIQATVVQYYDLQELTFDMLIRQQKLYKGHLPSIVQLNHDQLFAPEICLIKIYYIEQQQKFPDYYIVYSQQNRTVINITIALAQENQCRNAMTVLQG
ncbi:unnamed protein product [Rotaria sp. Silwood2]|nr:unnamed protein product [Rotaria sp. Silwood2]CAF2873959.1 unnamed protein product [Rotaria sp. Silwood2]CAF3108288.1 unnamed protein product [Rotaria sp. Silwood2]CAF3250220.1 unnamed protein product [Rotaria sp. Silwood2]CAF4321926.1 unnamed protein product [Rotaria sp. Silwood2]